MLNAKEQVRELLEVLPDDATFDEVHYHIFVREKIDQGLKAIEEGRIVSEEDMDANFKRWLAE